MEHIVVYKVVCNDCGQPFFELDSGLPKCPICGKETSCVHCTEETLVYRIDVNPLTGQVVVIGSSAEKEILS